MEIYKFLREFLKPPNDPRLQTSRMLLRICFGSIIGATIWAHFSEIDQVVTAQGKIVPQSRLQIVQHQEGGRIEQIHVRQGEKVKVADLLVSLSPFDQKSEYDTQKYNLLSLSAKNIRLQAQYDGKPLKFSDELVAEAPQAVVNETALYVEQIRQLQATLASHESVIRQKEIDIRDNRDQLVGLNRALEIYGEEFSATKKLVSRGLEPMLSELSSERAYTEARLRRNAAQELINRRIAEREEVVERRKITYQEAKNTLLGELTKARTDLHALQQTLPVVAGKIDRTSIRAPISGVVNRVLVSTEGGGVLKPNDAVIEIVPEGTELLLEVNLSPADIGFVREGQATIIKLTTYDFSVYGSMHGVVKVVGADAVANEKGESFYNVRIEPESQIFKSRDREFLIIPGMTAQADIITNKRTVLSYIMAPFTKALKASFREK